MRDELQTKLDNDFYVGNLATDLVDYTFVQKELFDMGYKIIFKKSKKKERVIITCLEP